MFFGMRSIKNMLPKLISFFIKVNDAEINIKFSYSIFLRTFNYFYLSNKYIPEKILVLNNSNSIITGLLWLLIGSNKIYILNAFTDFKQLKKVFNSASKYILNKDFDKLILINDKLNLDVYQKLFLLHDNSQILSDRITLINVHLDLLIDQNTSSLIETYNDSDLKSDYFDFIISINYNDDRQSHLPYLFNRILKPSAYLYYYISSKFTSNNLMHVEDIKSKHLNMFNIIYDNKVIYFRKFSSLIKEHTLVLKK